MKHNFYEYISEYVKGQLPDELRQDFEAALAQDTELAADVALERELIEAMQESDVLDLRAKLQASASSSPDEPNSPTGPGLGSWIAGIVLIVALLVGGFFLFNTLMPKQNTSPNPETTPPAETTQPNSNVSPQPEIPSEQKNIESPIQPPVEQRPKPAEQGPTKPIAEEGSSVDAQNQNYLAMAQQRYEQQPYTITLRGEPATSTEERMLQAEQAYLRGDYPEVIELLQTPVEGYQSSSNKLKAHALFRTGQYAEAATAFESLRSGFYKYDAEWYLLLCQLAQLPAKEAAFRELLTNITENKGHAFHQKALELQDELGRYRSF